MPEEFNCPIACPNRREKQLGKGYSFLFAIALTGLLGFSSLEFKYSRDRGVEVSSRDIPLVILIPGVFLIAGALGINTDPLAQLLGAFLDRRRP
jgi:hypothetical protein